MEPERTITERRTYWESLARKTSHVHVTDFEMGVLYGMSMKVDIERAQKESEKRDALPASLERVMNDSERR